jgi:hypothetical protein
MAAWQTWDMQQPSNSHNFAATIPTVDLIGAAGSYGPTSPTQYKLKTYMQDLPFFRPFC